MRITLLFVFLLNSVCGDTDVYGCFGGWFEFTCGYKNDQNLKVSAPRRPISGINIAGNKWRARDTQRSLYHNTTGKYWRVFVKLVSRNDFGEYECKNGQEKEIDLKHGKQDCSTNQKMAFSGTKTSINCSQHGVNFICKETSNNCDILFRGRSYSFINVSLEDQGVYWCGFEGPRSKGYMVSREKIHLQVVEVTKGSLTSPSPTHTEASSPYITTTYTKNTADPVNFASPTPTKSTDSLLQEDEHGKILVIVAPVCAAIVILLLALILFGIHKRRSSFTKATPINKEENCYEEIQERPQQITSGAAMKTIYATATAPVVSPGPDVTGNKKSDERFKDNVLYSTSVVP